MICLHGDDADPDVGKIIASFASLNSSMVTSWVVLLLWFSVMLVAFGDTDAEAKRDAAG